LEAARRVQMALLPSELPQSTNFSIGTRYVPMERVGGDFFDVVDLDDGDKIGILVADVCGHGIAAALVTAITKISFRNVCFKTTDPAEVLHEMNRALCANLQDGFVTAFYCIYEPGTQTLRHASGGHPPLLVHRRAASEILELEPQATFLGVFDDVEFNSESITLQAGDRVLLYTDGILEGQNTAEEQFGDERFYDIIRSHSESDLEPLLDDVLSTFHSFQEKTDPDDDITLVGLDIVQ
jgi:sigma-B regulation protein RsbU (phosphoserine phosphatase)